MTVMGRKYCRWSLCCSPEPIARLMRVFPKLALLFLVLHVSMMIYSLRKPFPNSGKPEKDSPPGVVDEKMKKHLTVQDHVLHIRQGMKNLTAGVNNTRIKGKLLNEGEKLNNKTYVGLLDKLNKLRSQTKLQQLPGPH